MTVAKESGIKTLAFCLLSGGIFRGSRSLKEITEIALRSIAMHAPNELT